MNEPTLTCQDEQRRHQVRKRYLNGLDYLEVSEDQRSLDVYFLGSLPENITKENIRIEGGQRIRDILVTGVELEIQEDPSLDSYLQIFLNKSGDFSTYTLRLVGLERIDPRYAYLNFSFKVGCPSDLDCKSQPICPEEERIQPEMNYLAKDYSSFRQLILDRLALIMPDWQERHVPDLGITLVELLAYVGDYLSYYQDAVATEAYLDTARQRISVRRHVRLVDYPMHEGCNARTWVWLETDNDTPLKLEDIYFITKYQENPTIDTLLTVDDLRNIPAQNYEVFEPIFTTSQASMQIYQAHNEIHFYTWGNRQCCLPKGATSATLCDAWIPPSNQQSEPDSSCDDNTPKPPPNLERKLKELKQGDFLIFEEVKGAKTGNEADADISHRHVVRLTSVEPTIDNVYTVTVKVNDAAQEMPMPVVEITWAVEDALPFPLCISAIALASECQLTENISVAHGNVILVDHGRTLKPEDLGIVAKKQSIVVCEGENQPAQMATVAEKFYPRLKYAPLTFRQPLSTQELNQSPATQLLTQSPQLAVPQITSLFSNSPENQDWSWTLQPDLLSSHNQNKHFVVEIDNQGYAHLRFGDGELGQKPEVDAHFFATYRIGNGIAGNISADTIACIVFRQNSLSGLMLKPHNPLPARGGTSPEPLSEVKLFAPQAFRQELQRAITADDYANIIMRDFGARVQRAAATLRWTGSWFEVLVAIDPLLSEIPDEELFEAITKHLYRFRRIGHDVVVKQAVYVPLDIAMTVCVQSNYLRGHVKADLLSIFSNRILPDGRRGFFYPDNLTFGTGIAVSKLVATAKAVLGVENVVVTKLQRLNEGDNGELDNGILPLSPLEIAQLNNDSNFPEKGKFKLDMRGSR
jgi:hypothetical protein